MCASIPEAHLRREENSRHISLLVVYFNSRPTTPGNMQANGRVFDNKTLTETRSISNTDPERRE
jgi:hypothetical protein